MQADLLSFLSFLLQDGSPYDEKHRAVEKPESIFKWIFKSSILYFKLGLAGLLKKLFLTNHHDGKKDQQGPPDAPRTPP
jgi:hypothetical protein